MAASQEERWGDHQVHIDANILYVLSTEYHVYQSAYYFFQRGPSIITLDPNKFAEKRQRPFRIANKSSFTPHIVHNQSGLVKGPLLYYDTRGKHMTPYSSDITGNVFLYYTLLPGRPRISGELRLRVTSRNNPSSFESGHDLLGLNGQPWSRPLFVISKCPSYIPLYEKLREDGFVPDDLEAIISTFSSSLHKYHRGQQLYTINDTFIVDFNIEDLRITVITEQGVEMLLFPRPFHDNRSHICRKAPYRGSYTNHYLD